MRRATLVLGGPLVLCLGTAAGQQPKATVVVSYTETPVRIDVEPREWRGVEPLRLRERAQRAVESSPAHTPNIHQRARGRWAERMQKPPNAVFGKAV